MHKELFAGRFWQAATRARDFARTLVLEDLPDEMRFRVELNSSYDGHPLHEDEVVFPEEGGPQQSVRLLRCTGEQVIELLWREGRVPEWINLSVSMKLESLTVIEVLACGRFTANDGLLYHEGEGYPPFHVTGPALPASVDDRALVRERFSVFDRSECATLDEFGYVADQGRQKTWSLDLHGPVFDDNALAAFPALESLEILELHGSQLQGPGLDGLKDLPLLRILRIYLDAPRSISLEYLPEIRSLDEILLANLAPGPWGQSSLPKKTERLSRLTLNARGSLDLGSTWPPRLERLSIRASDLSGGPLPARLDSLYFHVSRLEPSRLEHVLGSLETVSGLDLSDTPVADDLALNLVDRLDPRYMNLVRCGVSEQCLRRIRRKHPEMKLLPRR